MELGRCLKPSHNINWDGESIEMDKRSTNKHLLWAEVNFAKLFTKIILAENRVYRH